MTLENVSVQASLLKGIQNAVKEEGADFALVFLNVSFYFLPQL